MKSTIFLVALVAAFVPCIAISETSSGDCNCLDYPFNPNPPCRDVCYAKNLAIAPEEDLTRIFGLTPDDARKISALPPNARPRSIEGYRVLLGEAGFLALERRLDSLTAKDFALVRADAAKLLGLSIDKLAW